MDYPDDATWYPVKDFKTPMTFCGISMLRTQQSQSLLGCWKHHASKGYLTTPIHGRSEPPAMVAAAQAEVAAATKTTIETIAMDNNTNFDKISQRHCRTSKNKLASP